MGSDSHDEMHRFFGDDSSDRLLSGGLLPLDAPDHLRGVAELFEAAGSPAAPLERSRKGQVVPALAAAALSSQPQLLSPTSRKRAMLSKLLTAKVAAAATVAALGLGTAAAAATGSLPGQTSKANSHATTGPTAAANQPNRPNHANQPNHSSHGHGNPGHPAASGGNTNGSIPSTGPANIHAQYGLCTAFLAAGKNAPTATGGSTSTPPQYNSTAFKALIAQNGGVAATTSHCQDVVATHPTTTTTTTDTITPGDTTKPANTGKPAGAGEPSSAGTPPSTVGSANSQAPVSTPNGGGTGKAGTESGGANSTGSSTSGAASHGASSAGSGNSTRHP